MMDEILVAVISGVSALLASVIVAVISHRKSTAVIEYRLMQLEKKVDLHNSVIDRTYRLEEHAAVMDQKIKVADNRISDLEHLRSA